jgi:hypothetical protein
VGLLTTKRDLPKLWVKCPETGQMIFYKDLEANQFVVPGSNYHMRMAAQTRLAHLFDDGEYQRVPLREVSQDPLKFRDSKRYSDRLKTMKVTAMLDHIDHAARQLVLRLLETLRQLLADGLAARDAGSLMPTAHSRGCGRARCQQRLKLSRRSTGAPRKRHSVRGADILSGSDAVLRRYRSAIAEMIAAKRE